MARRSTRILNTASQLDYDMQPMRLERVHAARLLRTTSDSVLHIAVAVGYTGTSQFDSAFKALYHMTPAQYRKWCRENNVQNR